MRWAELDMLVASGTDGVSRCNNVLWIQGANQNNGNGDTKMEG